MRQPCRHARRMVAAFAAILALLPAALRAQHRAVGCGPRRVFQLDQESYWVSDGIEATAVSAVDTTVLAVPDSLRGCDLATTTDFGAASERGTALLPVKVARTTGPWRVRVTTSEPGQNWFEDSGLEYPLTRRKGGMVAELAAWLNAVPGTSHDLHQDTLITSHTFATDTVLVMHRRDLSPGRTRMIGGRKWIEMRVLDHAVITASRLSEWHLYSQGVRVRYLLAGDVLERFLWDPAHRETDSLRAEGSLSGSIVFAEADGVADTVRGVWTVRRTGDWREDPTYRFAQELHYFMIHGRDSGGASEEMPRPDPLVRLASAGDSAAVDSLLRLRDAAPDPFARRMIDSLVQFTWPNPQADRVVTAAQVRHYRFGDAPTLARIVLVRHYAGRDDTLGVDLAIVLERALGSVAVERRQLLDREEVFAQLLPSGASPTFTPAAGDTLAAAAQHTDDPLARDLLLLQAYRANPAKYRGLLERLADSTQGYGYIARQYVLGNTGLTGFSWGWRPSFEAGMGAATRGREWPGLDATWQAHRDYQGGSPGRVPIDAIREWFAARQLEPVAWARRRFTEEPSAEGRLVWAAYLLALDDTAALPWLRRAADEDSTGVGERSYQLMESYPRLTMDTVKDEAVRTELANLLLAYMAGDTALADTSGEPVRAFAPHNERPDQHYLLDDGLTASVRAHWGTRFTLVTGDSLKSLADRKGLQMALVLRPITHLGRRYFAHIALEPWTGRSGMCLCGGGTDLTLERRGRRWVVLTYIQWVS